MGSAHLVRSLLLHLSRLRQQVQQTTLGSCFSKLEIMNNSCCQTFCHIFYTSRPYGYSSSPPDACSDYDLCATAKSTQSSQTPALRSETSWVVLTVWGCRATSVSDTVLLHRSGRSQIDENWVCHRQFDRGF